MTTAHFGTNLFTVYFSQYQNLITKSYTQTCQTLEPIDVISLEVKNSRLARSRRGLVIGAGAYGDTSLQPAIHSSDREKRAHGMVIHAPGYGGIEIR